jgi:hypothetical protein
LHVVDAHNTTEELRQKHLELGAEITRTCYEGYHRMPTGIFPEILRFDDHSKDFRYLKYYI